MEEGFWDLQRKKTGVTPVLQLLAPHTPLPCSSQHLLSLPPPAPTYSQAMSANKNTEGTDRGKNIKSINREISRFHKLLGKPPHNLDPTDFSSLHTAL